MVAGEMDITKHWTNNNDVIFEFDFPDGLDINSENPHKNAVNYLLEKLDSDNEYVQEVTSYLHEAKVARRVKELSAMVDCVIKDAAKNNLKFMGLGFLVGTLVIIGIRYYFLG